MQARLVVIAVLAAAGFGCARLNPNHRMPPELAPLGTLQVDLANRELIITGHVNQATGVIELLACGPEGKTHESTFVLHVDPVDLQAGVLLLGIEPGTPPTSLGFGQPSGPEVDIWVDWVVEGTSHTVRAEQTVMDTKAGSVLPETGWVFTGSMIEDGQFMASSEFSLIATYWDPYAILNLPLPSGADDTSLEAYPAALPEFGTPITMRIAVRPPAAGD
jgi:hypothetical protein